MVDGDFGDDFAMASGHKLKKAKMETDCFDESLSDTSQNMMEDSESMHDTAISVGGDLKPPMEECKSDSKASPSHQLDPETLPMMITLSPPCSQSADSLYIVYQGSRVYNGSSTSPMLKSERRLLKKCKWKEQKSKSSCIDISYV